MGKFQMKIKVVAFDKDYNFHFYQKISHSLL